jgi:hypothetical protein
MKAKNYRELVDNIIYRSCNPNPLDFAIVLSEEEYKGFIQELKEDIFICSGLKLNEDENIYYKGYLIIKAKKI